MNDPQGTLKGYNQTTAAWVARSWMQQNPLFLDLETTGLNDCDQAIEVAVINKEGLLQFHSFIRPTIPIPAGATEVHHINDLSLRHACGFIIIGPRLWAVLVKKSTIVVTYNAEFDMRMLRQTAKAVGIDLAKWPNVPFACAMQLFAEYNGEMDPYRNEYRYKSLAAAVRLCGIELNTTLHRAAADAEACRLVVKHMAEQEEVEG